MFVDQQMLKVEGVLHYMAKCISPSEKDATIVATTGLVLTHSEANQVIVFVASQADASRLQNKV